jgi:hypothetical protein
MRTHTVMVPAALKGRLYAVVVIAAVLALPAVAAAQFGHPLKGQWSGQRGTGENQTRLLLDFGWDGKEISGRINPGSDTEGTVKKATFDYSNVDAWKVTIDAEGKDASGKVVPIRIEGTLENLGAYYRLFHGTWTQGGQKTPFTVTRN